MMSFDSCSFIVWTIGQLLSSTCSIRVISCPTMTLSSEFLCFCREQDSSTRIDDFSKITNSNFTLAQFFNNFSAISQLLFSFQAHIFCEIFLQYRLPFFSVISRYPTKPLPSSSYSIARVSSGLLKASNPIHLCGFSKRHTAKRSLPP